MFDNVKGIAFDLDGTLIDSAPGLADAVDNALYALELPKPGLDRVETWIGNGADVLIERALQWAQKEKYPTRPAEQALAHQSMARKLFDQFYADSAAAGSRLFPGVMEGLNVLINAGIVLALVTNKPTPYVAPILEALGISDKFNIVIGGDDVIHKKPHPEPILRVIEALSLSTETLLFVGDSRNDIQAARAAGCRCIGLTYGYNYGESIALSQPDAIIDNFLQLLPTIGQATPASEESTDE